MVRHTLYYSITTTGNALASITVPAAFTCDYIQFAYAIGSVTAATCHVEVSRSSVGVYATQTFDPVLARLFLAISVASAVGVNANTNIAVVPVNEKLAQGQPIYLNASASAAVVIPVYAILVGR